MYQAICPDCGATITLNVPGDIWAGCPSCEFYGQVPALATAESESQSQPSAPLSDARLAEIREWLTWAPDVAQTAESYMQAKANRFLAEALAEVEWQRAENVRANDLIESVAEGEMQLGNRLAALEADNERLRVFVRATAAFDSNQQSIGAFWRLQAQARALLATSESEASA